MRPTGSPTWRALTALLCAIAASASAQSDVSSSPPAPVATGSKPIGEYWAARLRYGLAYRTGAQQDSGPGLTYQGITPNDLSLLAWAWFGYAGLHLQAQREGFALFDTSTTPATTVTNGGLLRFAVQAAGRLPIGPLRFEPYVGYAFHQLPTFRGGEGKGSTLDPAFGAANRHSVLLAARLLLDVGIIAIEARGELPIKLAGNAPGADTMVSNGFAVGGGVRVNVATAGKLHIGALLDAQYVADNLAGKDASGGYLVASQQRIIRAGLGLDLQWKDVFVVPKTGGVIVRVVDVDTGAPLPGADVSITVAGEERPVSPDAQGALAARDLKPGAFTVRASAEGYLPFESAGSVTAGSDTPIEIKLKKEPPKVGTLRVIVTELDTKKPLANVTVTAGDVAAKTDENGVTKFEGLEPGPVSITLQLEGYKKGEEAGSVVAAKTSDVAVALVPEKKRVPAQINGLVRSTKGGTPIPADLEIPQAKIKTKADAKGAFTFRLEGGTYTVKISAPGYITQSKDVTVKDGDQAIFNVDLYPK